MHKTNTSMQITTCATDRLERRGTSTACWHETRRLWTVLPDWARLVHIWQGVRDALRWEKYETLIGLSCFVSGRFYAIVFRSACCNLATLTMAERSSRLRLYELSTLISERSKQTAYSRRYLHERHEALATTSPGHAAAEKCPRSRQSSL